MWSPALILVNWPPSAPGQPFSQVKNSVRKIYQKVDEIEVPFTSKENKRKAADIELTEIKAKKEEEKQKNAEEENKKRKTAEEDRKTAAKKEEERKRRRIQRAIEKNSAEKAVDEIQTIEASEHVKAVTETVVEGAPTITRGENKSCKTSLDTVDKTPVAETEAPKTEPVVKDSKEETVLFEPVKTEEDVPVKTIKHVLELQEKKTETR